jgi:hypothetical protein
MDCIFKTSGFIPKNHSCRSCIPLNILLSSIGYSKKESQVISKRIIRTFQIIKLEDISRDESNFRLISRTISVLLSASLPKKMRIILKKTDNQIKELEDSDPSATNYINQISKIGGELFESASKSKYFKHQLKEIGVIITKAVVTNDMKKDLRNDIETNKFNPFKKCGQKQVSSLFRHNIAPFNNLINRMSIMSKKDNYRAYSEPDYDDCGCPCFCYAFSFFPKRLILQNILPNNGNLANYGEDDCFYQTAEDSCC